MRPENKSQLLLGVTRSKAKMFEYEVPLEHHIQIYQDPAKLFSLAIGLLGDVATSINRDETLSEDFINLKQHLLFSAQFFDTYFQSKLNNELIPYLCIMGSASYYLCEMPGSATVLAEKVEEPYNLKCDGLEDLLLWLLKGDLEKVITNKSHEFFKFINNIYFSTKLFFTEGHHEIELREECDKLRTIAYRTGSPRQLLFCDVITAVVRIKINNSTWKALPKYSTLPQEKWVDAFKKKTFVKELWPAQHLLGQKGVLNGKSAVVQMPTSAGKTKAIEFIIRSAFLSERTSFVVIVAPFKALCHEIKNTLSVAFRNELIKVDELSDSMQIDFDIELLISNPFVLIVTPEKLLYVLRHNPSIANFVGLAIFDEGHQFDNGRRGVTYELLLTSLRIMLHEDTQKILISAVINNAEEIGEWLNGNQNVVEGANLITTYRSIGFASWKDKLGRIEYIDNGSGQGDFFVPRIIERINLGKRVNELKNRFFPEKKNGRSIALYLGFKLVKNGGVAIFCGMKMTTVKICEQAVEFIERGLAISLPLEFSNLNEVERLHKLYSENLGPNAFVTKSAKYGIFSHHGNTPHGIRLAVEYAMQEDLVRFIICTSTLAQGVNLPIRYLIISGFYQGQEKIKVRDFHNLIGRAGRSGMHTEGSIIFSDINLFDKKEERRESWRWENAKNILDPENSESCKSNILTLFDPIQNDKGKIRIKMDPLSFVNFYVDNPESISNISNEIVERYGDKGFSKSGVQKQIFWRMGIIMSIESFILSSFSESEGKIAESEVIDLAKSTLAYFLAEETEKDQLCELFKRLSENIENNVLDKNRRKVYGKTLYGLIDALEIEEWIKSNIEELYLIKDEFELLEYIWPLLTNHISTTIFHKFDNIETLKNIANGWINGKPYHYLLDLVQNSGTKMIWGTKRHSFQIEHMVEVCEGALSYDGGLLIGALCEFIEVSEIENTEKLIDRLHLFQKQLKYGLKSKTSVSAYESGFADRVIAQELSKIIGDGKSKLEFIHSLKINNEECMSLLKRYPKYYEILFESYNR